MYRNFDVLAEVRKLDVLAEVRKLDPLAGLRELDMLAEVRKLAGSKPVHAAAGVGLLASQTLRDLPGLMVRWRTDNPVAALPVRATGYVQTARAKTVEGYDMLADRGEQALGGHDGQAGDAPAAHAKSVPAAQAKDAPAGRAKSTPTARGKNPVNGKARAKTPSRTAPGN